MKRVNSVYVPLELIMQILLRLPVKTLLCYKCVCKSWLSLISDPSFATSHFEHAGTHRLVLINGNDHKFPSIDVDASLHDDSAHASLTLDFLSPQCNSTYCLDIRGSCRGFLFILYRDTDFYLWNPSTGVNKQIPDSPLDTFRNKGFELLSGFAYDHSTDDYLIVSGFYKLHPGNSSIKLMIFSLRANKWKPIEVASHLPYKATSVSSEYITINGLFLNGSIHWMVYNYETLKNVIITFDLKEMAMLEIALPDDINNSSIECDLLVIGGLIGAWMKDLNTVKIYVMQKYGVHSSWTKIIQFSVNPVLHRSLYILCLTNCGDIVGTNDEGLLVKFNDKGNLLEQPLCHKNYSDIYDYVVYGESLISLPNND